MPDFRLAPGLLLIAACGARSLDPQAGESAASETGTDEDTTDSGSEPECVDDADCPGSDICVGGECVFDESNHHGNPECEGDWSCEDFEICEGEWPETFCVPAGSPPPDCESTLAASPIEVEGTPLALRFADLDDDGPDELVVATETELWVFSHGEPMPSVTGRAPSSASVEAMIAGHFDPAAGEDLLLLVGPDLHAYASDGNSGFAAASVSPAPSPDTLGLLAGDFDGIAPTDRVSWGPSGALLERGGELVTLVAAPSSQVTAFEHGDVAAGFLVSSSGTLQTLDADGNLLASAEMWFSALTAVEPGTERRYIAADNHSQWSKIYAFDPSTLARSELRSLPEPVNYFGVGDFDGDGRDDLVTIGHSQRVLMWFDPLAIGCILANQLPDTGLPLGHSVGDHDGDGDDEVAVRYESGALMMFEPE